MRFPRSGTWKRLRARTRSKLPEDTYREIVRLLLSALFGSAIMTLTFMCLAGVIWAKTQNDSIAVAGALGAVAGLVRTAFLACFRHKCPEGPACAREARRWEHSYAVLSFGFATVLGIFGALTIEFGPPVTHLLAAGLVFGYCSGAVARISIRSWIAVPCLFLATLPVITVCLFQPDGEYRTFAAFLALFLAGGIESAHYVGQAAVRQLTMQREFASLARHDDLTGLPNRLAMRTHLGQIAKTDKLSRIAVHCLDLDRFKPVNDRYGHPVGDALLKAVAGRLKGLLRANDLAVRMGGDEFVILQADVDHPDQADMLARRILRDLGAPFKLGDQEISIGVSVGYALATKEQQSLEQLLESADAALCRVKQRGGGISDSGEAEASGPVKHAR